jgi:cytochrome P450
MNCLAMAFAKLELTIVTAHLLRSDRWELHPDPATKDGLQVGFSCL